MVQAVPISQGYVRVVPPGVLNAAIAAQDTAHAAAQDAAKDTTPSMAPLAAFIRSQFEMMKRHRSSQAGWNNRLLAALRAFNGEYDANKLAEIKKFGGSEVYAKIIAMKCRGASSLLRDVYLSSERPWGIAAPPDPKVPDNIVGMISQLIQAEATSAHQAGQPPDPGAIRDRVNGLMEAARQASKKNAKKQAKIAEDKVDELLVEGNFYKAFAEFLVDLPLFPFACLKGPVVRMVPSVSWEGGRATIKNKAKLFWLRISPFDLWFTPGVSDIEDAATVERQRVTRADLNDLLDLPGYNQAEVRAVLEEYGRGGLNDNWDTTDAERAVLESRENPWLNQSGMLSCLEFNGNVQGLMLLEYGMDPHMIADPLRDYMVQAWLIGTHVIKVQMSPSPRKRHPYFITSFEKVPGTPVGNALPDILSDIQETANATLRAMVNNLSIASGPQVVVNKDRLAPGEDGEDLYPWKRWSVTTDPFGNTTQVPISFFQPNSNAQEMLTVYTALNGMADDLSAIPRYMQGGGAGGAGRTASGLAMLMGNASKILQTVAANVDRDVLDGVLTNLFDLILLTDSSGLLNGEETVRVMGVAVAIQRETERARQLEFLQVTANPVDMAIMGPDGRAKVLRNVSKTIGMDGEEIVPSDDDMKQKMAASAGPPQGAPGSPAAPNMANAAAQAQGGQHGPAVTKDMGPRTRITGGAG